MSEKANETLLLEAAEMNNIDVLNNLLKNGVDIDFRDDCDTGRTALMKACRKGNIEAVKLLLENGADPNLPDCDLYSKNTAFIFACIRGCKETVKLMLDKYVDISKPESRIEEALQMSAFFNRPEIVTILLDAGADPNVMNDRGFTPLVSACFKGGVESAKILIERGADVNVPRYYKESLLAAVTFSGENIRGTANEIIDLLERNGALWYNYRLTPDQVNDPEGIITGQDVKPRLAAAEECMNLLQLFDVEIKIKDIEKTKDKGSM